MRSCRFHLYTLGLLAAVWVAACGDNVDPVQITGTVSGLAGSGLVLSNNGSADVAVTANGEFSFPSLPPGKSYAVTVKSQPSSPSQTCTVAHGTGIVGTVAVADIQVTCQTGVFLVGGTVTGLLGSGLSLRNNGGDDLSVTSNGVFSFATPVASGGSFAVTVQNEPSGPTQTCTVSGGTGVVGAGSVTTVVVNCSTERFTVGGVVDGLAGTVVLQNNAGDNITVSSNGSFAFPTTLLSGTSYAVTVLTQPAIPSQTCVVSSGTGMVTSLNVTSVRVSCTTNSFTVGGTVTGLDGSGLVLQDNAGDNLPITTNGAFTFATPVASATGYAVTVLTQPVGRSQSCVVTNATGTIAGANVTNVVVTCTTKKFTVGGTVTNLLGSGLVLQDNNGDDLAVQVGASGTFTFATPIASGATYTVSVLTQPSGPTQTCTVSGATGVVGAANVTSVVVDCATNQFTVGGTISGLAGTVVLQDNGGSNLTLTANGSFAFSTPLDSGTAYVVTVLTNPASPSQTCSVTNGAGTVGASDITNVAVTCVTNSFTVGGTITGLTGTGLVIQNNGGDNITVPANTTSFTFAMPVQSGTAYVVSVAAQPTNPSQTCAVTNQSGVMGGANVTNVSITCTTDTFLVGGTVTGLAGAGLRLHNGADSLDVTANGAFHFAAGVPSNGTYAATVFAQPTTPSQTCVVSMGSGTVTNADVTNIVITCTTNQYNVSVSVTGLAGSGLVLQDNGGDDLSVTGDGVVTFASQVPSNAPFNVTVLAQPTNPTQVCSVTGGTGIVGGGDVTSVTVNCTTNRYTISGTISGLSGQVVLQNNLADDVTLTGNGGFAFATTVASANPYSVTVLTSPTSPNQTCVVTSGTGTVTNSNVSNVVVQCTTDSYTIGGTVTGLASGESVTLRDNGADPLVRSANGAFVFATPVANGSTYTVTVSANPTSPVKQTCVVTNYTGTVGTANVTNVVVTCTTDNFTVGGSVSGLTGSGLVLRNNGGDNRSITANGSFTFATPVASGSTYAVTVGTQPVNQTCTVTNGSGTVTTANVTNIGVTCSAVLGCGAPTGTLHWALIDPHPCNAWSGGSTQWPSQSGSFTCDNAHLGGWLWIYSSSTTPPPVTSPSNNYGWVTNYCSGLGCFVQPGAVSQGSCSSNGSGATMFQCCN